MSDRIQLKGELSHNRVLADRDNIVHVLLQVQAAPRTADDGADRLPLNVTAVLDRSSSMDGAPIEAAKRAVSFLIEQLTAADYAGLVTFSDDVHTVLESGPVAFKEPLQDAVKGVFAGGMTNLSGGLVQGGRETSKHLAAERVNRVLLLTDGQANKGVTAPAELVEMARRLRDDGVLVTTMGLGRHFDEDLLAAMADAGGGNFHYIADADVIPAVFARELDGLLAVAAQGLTLNVRVPAWAKIHDVYGFPCDMTEQEAAIALPDLYTGEVKSLVLALEVSAQPAGTHELVQAELTYHDVHGSQGDVQLGLGLDLALVGEDETDSITVNETVAKEVHQAEAARAFEQAIAEADRGDFGASYGYVQAAVSNLSNYGGDADVAEQLQSLRAFAAHVRESSYDADVRKTARQQSRDAYVGRRRRQ